MAKLYFYYAAMNAGKSTMLLQAHYNYAERGMKTLLFIPKIGDRGSEGEISSRIGISSSAITFDVNFDFFSYVEKQKKEGKEVACILVDEAQFLKKAQIQGLCRIVDQLHIAVLTYGLRTDFQGELFEGSEYLLAWAENIQEVKNMCHCGKKAIMNMRVDERGKKVVEGPKIQLGGNDLYVAVCRYHFTQGEALPFEDMTSSS